MMNTDHLTAANEIAEGIFMAEKSAEIHEISIDGTSPGKAFEGIGALSAGASSRLLYDYPEPQRSDILDYLFKPGFGASLHHLKVEIGGDVNSTDGSEPSHAITREEFENPKPEYFFRGYEWWLMVEARKRNPDIILEGLQWGAPGWIGDGHFFSEDNAGFVSSWLKGMKQYHGLDIDYVGVWNEREQDGEYIKLLRKTLDVNGLQKVKIDAGDLWQPQEKWEIADRMLDDPELRNSIAVVNAHTTAFTRFFTPPNARKLELPLWDGEAHAYGGDWYAAAEHARFNRAYTHGGITKMISWSLISSYHDYLIVPGSGMMKANSPWSGHYEVQPPLWVIAHTNQFARPGWRYLDSGCKVYSQGPEFLREGFSVSTLKSDNSNDYNIVIETMDTKEPQRVRFTVSDDLSQKPLAVWKSGFNKEAFERVDDLVPAQGVFEMTLERDCVYTLTTTRGQRKGLAVNSVPPRKDFPFPFSSAFDGQECFRPGRYLSDQHGTFEIADRPDGQGRCLRQMAQTPGICWRDMNEPHTLLGDATWSDYTISVDILLPEEGSVTLLARINELERMDPYRSYNFTIQHDGGWVLRMCEEVLASGQTSCVLGKWHNMELECRGKEITARVDHEFLCGIEDARIVSGMVGLGTGWNRACFDNLLVR